VTHRCPDRAKKHKGGKPRRQIELERRVAQIALRWFRVGHGWLMGSSGVVSDRKLCEKLENACAAVVNLRTRKK